MPENRCRLRPAVLRRSTPPAAAGGRRPAKAGADGQQRSAIRHAVVKHESKKTVVGSMFQGPRIHTNGMAVLGQEVTGGRLQDGKSAAERQADAGKRDKEAAVAQQRI